MKQHYKFLIVLIFFTFAKELQAQNYQWDWAKNGGGTLPLTNQSGFYNNYERVVDIAVDSNNNYYYLMQFAGGNPNYDGNSLLYNDGYDLYIVSTDCQGVFRWDKELGTEFFSIGYSIQIDGQDNIYVSGITTPRISSTSNPTYWDTDFVLNSNLGFTDPGPHNRSAFIVKYDDQGVYQWIKFPDNGTLTGQEVTDGFLGEYMQVESNGTIHWLVSIGEGTHVDGNVTVPAGTDQQWIALRYDSNGVYLGHTDINFSGAYLFNSFSFDYDSILSVYYFSAFRRNNDPLFYRGNPVGGNTFIVAIDEVTGNDLWYKDGASDGGTSIYDIETDSSSNVFITGTSQTNASTASSFAGYQFDQMGSSQAAFVIALDSSGNLLWGNNSDTFTREGKTITVNGNEVALGYGLEANDTWDGITVPYGVALGEDPAVVRLNKTTGVAISIEQIEGTAGQFDEVTALAVDNFGNYVVGGYMKNQLFLNDPNVPTITKNGGPADFFIARLAKTDCNGVPLSNEDIKKPQTSIYPNPSTDWISINSEQEFSSFSVYNVSGQQFLSSKLTTDQRLDISSLSNGMYFLKLEKDGQEIKTLKLIKE